TCTAPSITCSTASPRSSSRAGHTQRRKSPRPRVGGFSKRLLLGLLQDLDQPPALGGRQRTSLHERHPVADAGDAVLVVRLDLLGRPDDLAVERVALAVLQLDHDGLLHLVAHHVADGRLAAAPRLLGGRSVLRPLLARTLLRRVLLGVTLSLCHYESSPPGPDARPSSRSRRMVYTRAISFRTMRSRRLLDSWPVAIWKRRLNSSSLDSRSRSFNSSSVSSRSSPGVTPTAIRTVPLGSRCVP